MAQVFPALGKAQGCGVSFALGFPSEMKQDDSVGKVCSPVLHSALKLFSSIYFTFNYVSLCGDAHKVQVFTEVRGFRNPEDKFTGSVSCLT